MSSFFYVTIIAAILFSSYVMGGGRTGPMSMSQFLSAIRKYYDAKKAGASHLHGRSHGYGGAAKQQQEDLQSITGVGWAGFYSYPPRISGYPVVGSFPALKPGYGMLAFENYAHGYYSPQYTGFLNQGYGSTSGYRQAIAPRSNQRYSTKNVAAGGSGYNSNNVYKSNNNNNNYNGGSYSRSNLAYRNTMPTTPNYQYSPNYTPYQRAVNYDNFQLRQQQQQQTPNFNSPPQLPYWPPPQPPPSSIPPFSAPQLPAAISQPPTPSPRYDMFAAKTSTPFWFDNPATTTNGARPYYTATYPPPPPQQQEQQQQGQPPSSMYTQINPPSQSPALNFWQTTAAAAAAGGYQPGGASFTNGGQRQQQQIPPQNYYQQLYGLQRNQQQQRFINNQQPASNGFNFAQSRAAPPTPPPPPPPPPLPTLQTAQNYFSPSYMTAAFDQSRRQSPVVNQDTYANQYFQWPAQKQANLFSSANAYPAQQYLMPKSNIIQPVTPSRDEPAAQQAKLTANSSPYGGFMNVLAQRYGWYNPKVLPENKLQWRHNDFLHEFPWQQKPARR